MSVYQSEIDSDVKVIGKLIKGVGLAYDLSEFGDVNLASKDGLLLCSYAPECQFKRPEEWTAFERASRGLIYDIATGEVVARPFDKFWNLGEVALPDCDIDCVTIKWDGSLGIVYHHNGAWNVATRGSFESDQAKWARIFMSALDFQGIPESWTLLFEIIYPENKIVIDYGNTRAMILLAIRDRVTGGEYSREAVEMTAERLGVPCAADMQWESIDTVKEAVALLGPNEEGFVVRYVDGTRLKLKGEQYVQIHRFLSQFSLKAVAEAMVAGTLDDLRAACPESRRVELNEMVSQIQSKVLDVTLDVEQAFAYCIAPIFDYNRDAIVATREGRKAFALKVMADYKPLSSYLFALLDNKLSQADIIRKEFLS